MINRAKSERHVLGPGLTPEQIFREYAGRVYNLARQLLGSNADADDVAQDVFVQVVRKLHSFRGEAALPTWLHRVTVNAALSYRRKRAACKKHFAPDFQEELLENGSCRTTAQRCSAEPEKLALEREMYRLVEAMRRILVSDGPGTGHQSCSSYAQSTAPRAVPQ
jgi:RNA polymerase sigma-70 factor (ECF subfamily)